jgi:hypothetical protein
LLASIWGTTVWTFRSLIDFVGWLLRLNAGLKDELQPTPRPQWWINVGAILLTIAATGAAYEIGLSRNMHRVAPDGVDAIAQSTAIDLSHRFYGTSGYVGRTEVLETLFSNGLTGRQNYLDKLGIQYPANVEMPDLANDAIQKAMNLKNLPKDATFANRLLYAPEANDPGIVDYIGWSFDLFGFRVESFYYFYFLVLSIAIVLFLICFWADALPLLVLAGVMVAFLFLVDSHMFDTPMLRTVHNQRFLGTLCIVSYLHLLFSILIYRRPTPLRVVLTLLQAAVFIFVMFTRSSAFWLILAVAIIIALHVYYRAGRPADEPRKANAARLALSWPALVIVAGLAGSLIYKSAVLHPIYSIGIFLPYHMIWHNAYMGMGLHPDWETRGDKRDGKPIPGAGSDNSAWIAALDDAEKRYGLAEIDTVNGRVGGLPGVLMALHEKLIKERFLRFAVHNPRFMLELYLWHKPKWLFREFAWAYGKYDWRLSSLLCLAGFLALATITWRRLDIPPHVRWVVGSALTVTAVMSLAAPFWTYPLHPVLGETFLLWTSVLLYFATLLLSRVWPATRPAVGQRA